MRVKSMIVNMLKDNDISFCKDFILIKEYGYCSCDKIMFLQEVFGIDYTFISALIDIFHNKLSFTFYHDIDINTMLFYDAKKQQLLFPIKITIFNSDIITMLNTNIDSSELVDIYKNFVEKLNHYSKLLKFDVISLNLENKRNKRKANYYNSNDDNDNNNKNKFKLYYGSYHISKEYPIGYIKHLKGYDIVFIYSCFLPIDKLLKLLKLNKISSKNYIPFHLFYLTEIKKDKNNRYITTIEIGKDIHNTITVREKIKKKKFGELGYIEIFFYNFPDTDTDNNTRISFMFLLYNIPEISKLIYDNENKEITIERFERLVISKKENYSLYKKARKLIIKYLKKVIYNKTGFISDSFINSYIKLKREVNIYDFLLS